MRGIIRWPKLKFSQDTSFNTPTLAIRGIFNDHRESGHPFNIPSERQHSEQGNGPFTALGFDLKTGGQSAPYWSYNTTSSSIWSPIQDSPCFASEASQQWDAGWYAVGNSCKYYVTMARKCIQTRFSPA